MLTPNNTLGGYFCHKHNVSMLWGLLSKRSSLVSVTLSVSMPKQEGKDVGGNLYLDFSIYERFYLLETSSSLEVDRMVLVIIVFQH